MPLENKSGFEAGGLGNQQMIVCMWGPQSATTVEDQLVLQLQTAFFGGL